MDWEKNSMLGRLLFRRLFSHFCSSLHSFQSIDRRSRDCFLVLYLLITPAAVTPRFYRNSKELHMQLLSHHDCLPQIFLIQCFLGTDFHQVSLTYPLNLWILKTTAIIFLIFCKKRRSPNSCFLQQKLIHLA